MVEIDGASNRGIEEIRELKSHVSLAPFQSPHKIFIIDEVHMLTEPAFNALLKTLEEPPARVYFILATTEPQKVPVTIRSRCVHLPFQRIPNDAVVERLREVANREGVAAQEPALWEIARQADGALRDALSLLEQVLALDPGKVEVSSLRRLLGGTGREDLERWLREFRRSPGEAFLSLSRLAQRGANLERLLEGFYLLFRDLLFFRTWGEGILPGLGVSREEGDFLRQEASCWSETTLERLAGTCASLLPRARQGLRADVFSGLLFQALQEPSVPTAPVREPAPSALPPRSRPTPPPSPAPPEEDPFLCPFPEEEPREPERVPPEVPPPAGDRQLRDPSEWPPLVAFLGRQDLSLAAAVLGCRILRRGEEACLEIPPEDRILGALLRSPRGRRILEEGCGALWGLPLEGVGTPPPEASPLPSTEKSGSFRVPESVSLRREPEETPPSVPSSEEEAGRGEWIHEAISWLDAEVLYVRRGSAEGEDLPEEESGE